MLGLAIPPGLFVGALSWLTATAFTNTVSTGVIILSALAAVATVVGIVYGVKWKTAFQVEHAVRETLDDRVRGLVHERDDVIDKLEQATAALHDAAKTISRLEALPNLERVLELMNGTFEKIMRRIDALHEENKEAAVANTDRVIEEIRRQAA